MPFKKGNTHALRLESEPLDRQAIAFKPRKGVTAKIKQIPNWQARLRSYADLLVKRHEQEMNRIEGGKS